MRALRQERMKCYLLLMLIMLLLLLSLFSLDVGEDLVDVDNSGQGLDEVRGSEVADVGRHVRREGSL